MTPKPEQPHGRRVFFIRPILMVALIFSVLALAGCSRMHIPGTQPKSQIGSLQLTNRPTGPVTLDMVQQRVMRYADTYAAAIAQGCDDVSMKATNPAVRLSVLRWKLGQSTAAFTDATGENPVVNALDLLVLTTLARMVVEDYGVQTYGDAILPLLDAQRNMETNAWMMASGVLNPSHQKELRDLIAEWRVKNPNQRYIGPIRFSEFANALGRAPTPESSSPTSIFSLLYLNPLAGLDPTTAAIQQTKDLAERAMYYGQHLPMLMTWQVEVLAFQLAGQPATQQVLNDANQLTASADVFAQTAKQLPQLVNDQRQAAIQQILDGLTDQINKSGKLMTDTRLTLDSAGAAATNINAAIQSLTAFVQYVSPTNATSEPAATNSPPFNILDYGTAATQIGTAAGKLDTLLVTLNQSTSQLGKIGQQTKTDADEVVRHAFVYGLILVLVLLAGSVLAALFYRILVKKLLTNGRKPDAP
jgi:hypothetical protein